MTSRSDRKTIDPAELRKIFGENLRRLSAQYPSIAGLCRDLGINRTQFNRYLSSESFPRPDVLYKICEFFDVDARILLEPVDDIQPAATDLLSHPVISNYLGNGAVIVPLDIFPDGFYRFSRRSFLDETKYLQGLVYVFRRDGYTFIRGYEAKEAMRQQGLSIDPKLREFRGLVMRQEDGLAALISRPGATTCTFNFLSRVTSFQNNFWDGYCARTTRESIAVNRITRVVFEHIHDDIPAMMATARNAGLIDKSALPTFHKRLLRIDEPFR